MKDWVAWHAAVHGVAESNTAEQHISFNNIYLFIFGHKACQILFLSMDGTHTPAVEAKNPNHWTTKEILGIFQWAGQELLTLNAFPHHFFKMLCEKTKCCGNPILYSFSSDLPCELYSFYSLYHAL